MRHLAMLFTLFGLGLAGQGCGPSSRGSGATAAATSPSSPAAAEALVGPDVHRTLRIEVDHVEGHAPDPAALELLRERLVERTDHPDGVEVVVDDVLASPGTETHTVEDVRALAASCLDPAPSEVAVIHVLYLDGAADFSFGYDLAGAAMNTTIVVFHEAIQRVAADEPAWAMEIEQSTLLHETGHALGLVGDGAPEVTPHQDPSHPGHCDQPGCVMAWTQEEEQALDFCELCKDDLRAIGGR